VRKEKLSKVRARERRKAISLNGERHQEGADGRQRGNERLFRRLGRGARRTESRCPVQRGHNECKPIEDVLWTDQTGKTG